MLSLRASFSTTTISHSERGSVCALNELDATPRQLGAMQRWNDDGDGLHAWLTRFYTGAIVRLDRY